MSHVSFMFLLMLMISTGMVEVQSLNLQSTQQARDIINDLRLNRQPVRSEVSRACAVLESGAVIPAFPSLWRAIDGDWRLLYSNNAPPRRLEIVQRIDSKACKVFHILRGGSFPLEVELVHTVAVTSDSFPAQISIDLDEVRLGTNQVPFLSVQSLLPPGIFRRGFFDVTFVDEEIRVSRGPFGELRVFERISS